MGFLREHKLSRDTDFHAIIEEGKAFMVFPFRFSFVVTPAETSSCLISVVVPKKRFHFAVDRNLLKRRMRECIRQQFSSFQFEKASYKILIVYCSNEKMSLQDMQTPINKGFMKIIANEKNN